MTTSTKKADTPKKTVKNGKVYGDALSAAEKKKIVMQKKKDKNAKKIPKSAQQTRTGTEETASKSAVCYTHIPRIGI